MITYNNQDFKMHVSCYIYTASHNCDWKIQSICDFGK